MLKHTELLISPAGEIAWSILDDGVVTPIALSGSTGSVVGANSGRLDCACLSKRANPLRIDTLGKLSQFLAGWRLGRRGNRLVVPAATLVQWAARRMEKHRQNSGRTRL